MSELSRESDGLRVVWKFALNPASGGQHAMPDGAQFLHLGVQGEAPVMWWSLPASEAKNPDKSGWKLRTFSIATTGAPGYAPNVRYVGTFQLSLPGGEFVGHVMAWEAFDRAD